MKKVISEIEFFQDEIVNFYQKQGRKDLPWRRTNDPWKILLAEILLRKTTSAQAVSVFSQISIYSPSELASVPEALLTKILKPLGLYEVRTKLLKVIASKVQEAGNQQLQNEVFLHSLPGVGNYIVNSVLCFAFDEPKPALDTNMIRVLTRVFAYKTERSRAREDRRLWEFAESLVPERLCKEYNWGILDFAWMICKPRNPLCEQCPLSRICRYYKEIRHDQEDRS